MCALQFFWLLENLGDFQSSKTKRDDGVWLRRMHHRFQRNVQERLRRNLFVRLTHTAKHQAERGTWVDPFMVEEENGVCSTPEKSWIHSAHGISWPPFFCDPTETTHAGRNGQNCGWNSCSMRPLQQAQTIFEHKHCMNHAAYSPMVPL